MRMEAPKKLVAAGALVVIVLCLFSLLRGCSCSRPAPKMAEQDRVWLLLTQGGWFYCPECRQRVVLTEEQQKLALAPEMNCPHCGRKVQWTNLAAPPPGPGDATPPAKKAPLPYDIPAPPPG
jgi:DNA-directed RNA polymerase subunit RPC12/RpoP